MNKWIKQNKLLVPFLLGRNPTFLSLSLGGCELVRDLGANWSLCVGYSSLRVVKVSSWKDDGFSVSFFSWKTSEQSQRGPSRPLDGHFSEIFLCIFSYYTGQGLERREGSYLYSGTPSAICNPKVVGSNPTSGLSFRTEGKLLNLNWKLDIKL